MSLYHIYAFNVSIKQLGFGQLLTGLGCVKIKYDNLSIKID